MKRILLLDSSAALYRYHHSPGQPILSSYQQKQINVTALHRYLAYTLEISRQFDFDQLVHVLDPEGGSIYRKELYPEYKAQRPPTPPEFAIQKKLLPKVLDAFGQYWIKKEGVEADDVISTLAHKHAERGDLVVVITPDKDLLQLVEDGRILIARPSKDAQGKRIHDYMDENAVFQKMGVRPDQIPDLLALMDDSADNLKGVHKCGPKTAAKWLEEFGDLPTLMTHASTISGKIGDQLREALPRLPLMQKLTMVLRDVEGVECLDEPLSPIHPNLLSQAKTLVMAKHYWPDNLREMVQPELSKTKTNSSDVLLPGEEESDPFGENASTMAGTRFTNYSF